MDLRQQKLEHEALTVLLSTPDTNFTSLQKFVTNKANEDASTTAVNVMK